MFLKDFFSLFLFSSVMICLILSLFIYYIYANIFLNPSPKYRSRVEKKKVAYTWTSVANKKIHLCFGFIVVDIVVMCYTCYCNIS